MSEIIVNTQGKDVICDCMKRILLVEDDLMIASGLVYALENEGYDPTHCTDIHTAINQIMTNKFDLAILDMQLPDGTGFDISNTKLQKLLR